MGPINKATFSQETNVYEDLLAARDEFEKGFERSRKGNLWQEYEGRTVSVFRRTDDLYYWSIADGDGPEYSPEGYESEEDAVGELWFVLSPGVDDPEG